MAVSSGDDVCSLAAGVIGALEGVAMERQGDDSVNVVLCQLVSQEEAPEVLEINK